MGSMGEIMDKPILCLDFDGVIHSYTSGWQGELVINDNPTPGAFEFIDESLNYFSVCVYSSRSKAPGGVEAMKNWFITHRFGNVDLLEFPTQKPAAFLTIDDRALTFTGSWPNPKELLSFKSWNKK